MGGNSLEVEEACGVGSPAKSWQWCDLMEPDANA